ncbi:MAG: hypothetical protein PHV23_05595 [Candidatus Gracilibacteria bacterium]|nr:hypothetical protein [Candidatus Gracilibacteria bacterium]
MLKKIIIIVFITICLFSFFKINENNYLRHLEIKENLVNHPENLPSKDIAKATAFGFKNVRADIYWMETIQYIGSNVFHSEYKKYLFSILDLVTELNPYFEKPYIIGQLLLPSYQKEYEIIDEKEQKGHTDEAIKIGLKGVTNFCDIEKIELIDKENDLLKIWNADIYKNPCLSYKVPYYLAYIYFFYKNDPINSAKYYKISSANSDSVEGAKTMSAIMQGKGGNREKSFFMFLNLAKFIEPENEVCNLLGNELESIGVDGFLTKKLEIDGSLLKKIENIRKVAFANVEQKELTDESKCTNYINKAIRELNLDYIERINDNFLKETGKNSFDAMELFNKGYLDYLPTDFQQYDDMGIIYKFNPDTNHYDYDMGRY